MRIMITGAAGFIGAHLSQYLRTRGFNVVEIDRKINKDVIDITPQDLMNVDIVVHLAAQTSVWNNDVMQIEKDNIQSFMYIFNLCKSLDKRFIYASSSCSVNITSMYGLSKHFDDLYSDIYKWNGCTGLRFHNVYGPNPRPDTLLGMCMNNKNIMLYNNGKNIRHFTYIDDVCAAVERTFYINGSGIYNVYNRVTNSTLEFVNEVKRYIDINVILTAKTRDFDKEYQSINNTYINLIDHPTQIEDGIGKIFN